MISSQEIIERSVYSALLETLISTGYSLRPDDYFPISKESSQRFKRDKLSIEHEKGFFITLFGIGNNQSRGMKDCPRITIESSGFMPGDIGLPKAITQRVEDSYFVSEFPYEAIDQFIDIHLVATNQMQIRLLHTILFASIPQRGYIKPYNLPEVPFDGNIFIEINNFFDQPDLDNGIIEKVYQFTVKDSLLDVKELPDEIPPINSIEVLLGLESGYYYGKDGRKLTDRNNKPIRSRQEFQQSIKVE